MTIHQHSLSTSSDNLRSGRTRLSNSSADSKPDSRVDSFNLVISSRSVRNNGNLRDTLLVCILCDGSYVVVTKDRVEASSTDINTILERTERDLQHKRLIHDLLDLFLVCLDAHNTMFGETPSSICQDGNGL